MVLMVVNDCTNYSIIGFPEIIQDVPEIKNNRKTSLLKCYDIVAFHFKSNSYHRNKYFMGYLNCSLPFFFL